MQLILTQIAHRAAHELQEYTVRAIALSLHRRLASNELSGLTELAITALFLDFDFSPTSGEGDLQ